MVFSVVGFGEVGSLVAALINSSYRNCTINVMNTSDHKSGRILDLEHAAACRNNMIHHNSREALSASDFIVYTAGYSNVHGESRNSVASRNRELVSSIFGNVTLKKNSSIIAITNPVEPVSYWLYEITGHQCNVIGTGTALDTYRLVHILSEHFNISKSLISTLVAGEHGQGMVPVYSQTFIDGKPIQTLRSEDELEGITKELKNAAFMIRETEKGTKYGVSQTTLELIHAILKGEELYTAVSTLVTPGELDFIQIQAPIFLSLPGSLKNGVFTRDRKFSFSESEKLALNQAAGNIETVIRP